MSESFEVNGFRQLGPDEEMDLDAIFGTGGAAELGDPFAETKEALSASAEEAIPEASDKAPASPPAAAKATAKEEKDTESTDGTDTEDAGLAMTALEQAFASDAGLPAVAEAPAENGKMGLFDKPPVFSYGGAKETIGDSSMTFEELRVQKADDFPELEEGKNVSWQVRYGDIRKSVADPKTKTIATFKEEIEKTKAFMDGLKKAKNKNPDCLVTPVVTAQKKGIASYKGIFPSVEEARASDKVISLFPARDGSVYEMRRNELGEFIAPKKNISELSEVRAGFIPVLPLVPKKLFSQLLSFFRSFMLQEEGREYEALANLYWDREEKKFVVHIPKQRVTKTSVEVRGEDCLLPEERYLHYMDIHSHNSMDAVFSKTDNADERATRLYIVVGHLERVFPEIAVRASCGGIFIPVPPSTVLEGFDADYPDEWLSNIECHDVLTGIPKKGAGCFALASDF